MAKWRMLLLVVLLVAVASPVDAGLFFRHRSGNVVCENGVCRVRKSRGHREERRVERPKSGSKSVKGMKGGWWPWDWFADDELPPPPQPDPKPLPDNPPEPAPTPVLPEGAALNEYVAKKLGGYTKANHERNGIKIDIYQARGRQRIAWAVGNADDWQELLIRALRAKAKAGNGADGRAGLALVCHCPPPEPTPAGGEEHSLLKFGGSPLVDAEEICRAAGLWLVIVHDADGEVSRVIYAP